MRLTGGVDRIEEWKNMAVEAQKEALKEAFYVAADYVLGRMKIENEVATKPIKDKLAWVDELYKKHGGYPLIVEEQARLTESLSPLVRNGDVIRRVQMLKNDIKLWDVSKIPFDDLEKLVLGAMDIISMVAPLKWQMIIGGSKAGAAYLYAIGATIQAEKNVDLESENMAIHLRAITAHQEHRERIMEKRNAVLAEIEAGERKRSDLPSGCPEFL